MNWPGHHIPSTCTRPPYRHHLSNLTAMTDSLRSELDSEWAEDAGLDPLTDAEQALADSLVTGKRVDLRVADQTSELSNAPVPVRASVIRALICGKAIEVQHADPRGLQIIGAALDVALDLNDVTYPRPLIFMDCTLPRGLSANRANLHFLHLDNCTVASSDGPALTATGLTVGTDLYLTGSYNSTEGRGAVRLPGAHIGGSLACNATVTSTGGPALSAYSLTVGGDVVLAGSYNSTGESNAIFLPGAHIGGQFTCDATLTNSDGPALRAQSLTVNANLHLTGSYNGTGGQGAVCLTGAHIGGQFTCDATLTNSDGPALRADGLTADADLHLTGSYKGTGKHGAICLPGAHTAGPLTCHATLTNSDGPALRADGLTADADLYLTGSYNGTGERGAIHLMNAHIGGQLTCMVDHVTGAGGPGLVADGLTADADLYLIGSYNGTGERGAVCLLDAHTAGQLTCHATLTSSDGPALAADGPTVDADLYLIGSYNGTGERGTIRLPRTHIGGRLVLPPITRGVVPSDWVVLDGLTYTGIPHTNQKGFPEYSVDDWIALLMKGTTAYAAQPWQQAAAAWQATGHDDEARRILIAQQEDRHRRVLSHARHPRWARAVSLFSKHLTGYGYQSWRSLVCLIALTAVSVTVTASFGTPSCGLTAWAQTGLAWAVPVIFSGIDPACTPATTWLTIVSWIIHVIGWVFVTLFITGFTGIIRKSHN